MILRGPLYLRVSGAVAPSALAYKETKLSRVKMPESLLTSAPSVAHAKRCVNRAKGVFF